MGKKLQGAALRAKKRQKAQVEELQEQQAEQVARQSVHDQTDKELFVLDTTGDHVPHNQVVRTKKKKKKTTTWSPREQEAIDKLVKKHSKEQLVSMAEQGKKTMDHKSRPLRTHGIRKAKTKDADSAFDLWGSSNNSAPETKTKASNTRNQPNNTQHRRDNKIGGVAVLPTRNNAGNKSRPPQHAKSPKPDAVNVAQPGQSYQPDPQAHQDVLREAVELEERRNQAEAEQKAPISPGMKPETRALLLSDSDSNSSDDEEDEDDEAGEEETPLLHKTTEKLTRAQRNKQKRVRREERQRLAAKKRKQDEHLVLQAKKFKKELLKDEQAQKERHAERQKQAQEKATQKLQRTVEQSLAQHDPVTAPSYPVALSSELQTGSSLRTLRPKGDLVTDRMASYAFRSLAPQLPSVAAANKVKQKRQRPKKKVKGAKEWVGEDFVIMK